MNFETTEIDFSQIDSDNPFKISPQISRDDEEVYIEQSLSESDTQCMQKERLLYRTKRNRRGRKVDDFDYKSRIDEELSKMGADKLEGKARKRVIQKIRNRLSANRSRMRTKEEFESLKAENQTLKELNDNLERKVRFYERENKKIAFNHDDKPYKRTNCVSKETVSELSPKYVREESMQNFGLGKGLFFLALVCVVLVFLPSTSREGVQMGGFLLSTPKTDKSLSRIEKYCEKKFPNKQGCPTPKSYIYKMRQQAGQNSQNNRVKRVKRSGSDSIHEVVPFKCYSEEKKDGSRLFLVDKKLVENRQRHKIHFVSELFPAMQI
jgi:hypothetical protein